MTAGRPIGDRIKDACEVLERIGPASTRAICQHLPDVEQSNMAKYCSRAVGLGLMGVERGKRSRVNFTIFTVKPDWRVTVEERGTDLPKPEPDIRESKWFGVSSVFSMVGTAR